MKIKMYKRNNFLKIFFSLSFGFSTVLLFGQPDPPPSEVPIDGNINTMLFVVLFLSAYVFIKKRKNFLNKNS